MIVGTYNVVITSRREPDKLYVFNLLSAATVSLSTSALENWLKGDFSQLNEREFEFLKDKLFIVENRKQERNLAMFRLQEQKNTNVVNLTIYTTYNCNFACFYCYEAAGKVLNQGSMSLDTVSSVCAWLEHYMDGRVFKHLNLTFYGGEPLLNMPGLLAVANHLSALCQQHLAELRTLLITNGSLLTPDVLNHLRKYNLSQVQITLDGAANIHNQTRPFVDGSPTYNVIKANLDQVVDICPVSLRMNTDLSKIHSAFCMLDDLCASGIVRNNNIFLEVAHIMDCGRGQVPESLSPEFVAARHSVIEYAVKNGFRVRNPLKLAPCHARTPGCFSILPDGRISTVSYL